MTDTAFLGACGLGLVLAAVVLSAALRKKPAIEQVVPVPAPNLDEMWNYVEGMLYEITHPYNRLKPMSDRGTLLHEVHLVGRRRTDPSSQRVLQLWIRQGGYVLEIEGSEVVRYSFGHEGLLLEALEGVLVNPAFSTNPMLGIERPVYLGPEAWTQDDQDREEARLRSLV